MEAAKEEYAPVQSAVTEYVRAFIRSKREPVGDGPPLPWTKIGELLGVSHVWPQQLNNPEKYGVRHVGPEVELRVARILHGGSIDALRRAAAGATELADGAPLASQLAHLLLLPEDVVVDALDRVRASSAESEEDPEVHTLSPEVRRAVLAVVHLKDCTIEQAMRAAHIAMERHANLVMDAEGWASKIAPLVDTSKGGSGTRPSVRLKIG